MGKITDTQISALSSKDQVPLNSGRTMSSAKDRIRPGKYFYLASVFGAVLLLSGCMLGHVASEPVYMQYNRPPQPSPVHLWFDGDWNWSQQRQTYIQQYGYWEMPRQGRTYIPGRWQTNSKGNFRWKKGKWVNYNNRRQAYYR